MLNTPLAENFKMKRKRGKELALYLFGFIICSAAITLLHNNLAIAGVFLTASFLLLRHDSQKSDFYFYIGAALLSLHEAVIVRFGAWHYQNPSILGLPVWLPLMYGLVAVVMRRIAKLYA